MRNGSFKRLMLLAWPIFIELLLQMLTGNIDQMMVANYSQDAVGGIANANQVLNILLLSFSMVSMATTILVSQYRGAGKTEKLEQIYTLSLLVNLVLSAVVGGCLFIFSDAMFRLLHIPDVFLPYAREYIHIVGGGCFLQALFMTFSAIFRSNQRMKTSMFVSILMNLVNVLGNALLIPHLGVAGAALSTVLSRSAGLCALMTLFYRSGERTRPSCLSPFPRGLLWQLISIGVPSGGESFSYNMTQLVVLSMVNSIGPEATTARAYCGMIASFALLYCLGVSQAAQVLVGHHVGEGDLRAAEDTTRIAVLSSILTTTAASVCVFLLIRPLLALFHAAPPVVELAQKIMFIDIFLQFGRSYNMLYLRTLQGAGDIHFAIAVGIADTWIVVVGLGYVLGCALGMGLPGIWIAMAMDENIRGMIFASRWRSGAWKSKRLVSAGPS